MTVNARTMPDDELFFGHKACAGCAGALIVRQVLKVLGPHAIAALPAGCMSAVGFNFPQLAFANNAMITPFAATASVLSGIEAGLEAQGIKPEDCTVVGFAGDGGTADIGLQALSGAIDRNDDVLYVCYDNEAYMNTGIQRSSLTPYGARTTTTPAGKNVHGCLTNKKNLFEMVPLRYVVKMLMFHKDLTQTVPTVRKLSVLRHKYRLPLRGIIGFDFFDVADKLFPGAFDIVKSAYFGRTAGDPDHSGAQRATDTGDYVVIDIVMVSVDKSHTAHFTDQLDIKFHRTLPLIFVVL